MSKEFESSIIIPVYNQWKYTEACLHALQKTISTESCEIIIVDNNSSDTTKEQCNTLGQELFGDRFRYHRCAENINFAPACNLGARIARGEFLIFLNNDTVPLSGWYRPLIQDFTLFPDIAATGPLLVYPETEPFGHTVQHLGVTVTPALKVSHLYEGIPAESDLAKKRRFFQIITAACMVIRRSVFFQIGMFDEHYINGYEDIDLCLRLWHAGYRMTVNPASRVVHFTSQTPGRYAHEEHNFIYFKANRLEMLTPDWHVHTKNDGFSLKLSTWLSPQATLPAERLVMLDRLTRNIGLTEIRDLLLRYPLWENGYRALAMKMQAEGRDISALNLGIYKLWCSPVSAKILCYSALSRGDSQAAEAAMRSLFSFCVPYEVYLTGANASLKWLKDIGMNELAEEYVNWLKQAETFREEHYLPFIAEMQATLGEHPNAPLVIKKSPT